MKQQGNAMRRKLAAGNWKMNGQTAALGVLDTLVKTHSAPGVDILICPPATLITRAADQTAGSAVAIGAQDCHPASSGAHTGDISAEMLRDAGARAVILGHSERRQDHGETDALVRDKATAAIGAGLTVILCLGETLAERQDGATRDRVIAQLDGSLPDAVTRGNLVVAYEPIWAIGTGHVPALSEIGKVHDDLRARLIERSGDATGADIRLLYGGSVKPSNAADIFAVANVDGALVGGASLKAEDFSPIITALEASD